MPVHAANRTWPCLEDIRTASRETPVTLRIAGTVRAGQMPKKRVEPGCAIRTMTGSVLPEGADCVIRFEDTAEPDDKILGIARDREASIIAKLAKGLSADAIITTGGVSKGDYDLTRIVIGKLGRMVFSRIRMAPGGAVAFALLEDRARKRQVPMFALSGPPMGCLVNFETLVRPALLKMLGREDVDHLVVTARANEAIPDTKGMAFVKWTKVSRTGQAHQVDFDPGGKAMILNLARANSITIIPAQTAIDTENPIEVLPLDWCHQ
jgi:molybdopterin molybdotransferase